MRTSLTSAIFIALLLTAFACGGDSEPDSAQLPDETDSVETLPAEETETAVEIEQPEETAEISTPNLTGSWDTTMGQIEFTVDDTGSLTGEYPLGIIEGTLTANVLEFTYSEGSLTGTGTFTFTDDFNSFTGSQDISGTELVWNGNRLQVQ